MFAAHSYCWENKANIETLKNEAQIIMRKGSLVKKAADRKYEEAKNLRRQAGILRGEASAHSREVLSRAEFNQDTADFFGDIFGLLSNVAPINPSAMSQMSKIQPTVSFLNNYQQKSAGQEMNRANSEVNQLNREINKQAMPMEIKAQTFDAEADRLMEAYNKISAIANVKFLLVTAYELNRSIKTK